MKMEEIKAIASKHQIKAGKATKSNLVRLIQHAEGNSPCFDSKSSKECGQNSCLWREDSD